MYIAYLAISIHLAQTFLSYFVGASTVNDWIFGSPLNHPIAFLIVAGTAGLMMFDFAFFREQVCCVVCPYARMQGALTDQDSLIVTYDEARGEPRGKKRRTPKPQDAESAAEAISLPVLGDCIDCTMCVQTCPTGIDIRMGPQLECIGCAQCIDACDSIMDKINRPRGLIRYSSENAVAGSKTHLMRPRIIIYPLILLLLFVGFLYVLNTKGSTDVWIGREAGLPFYTLPSGEITNQLRTRITNRSTEPTTFTISVIEPQGIILGDGQATLTVEPGEETSTKFAIIAPPEVFTSNQIEVLIRITDSADFTKDTVFEMKGRKFVPTTNTQPEPSDD